MNHLDDFVRYWKRCARTVAASTGTWLTSLPGIEQGFGYPMDGPGLGTALLPDVRNRADVASRRSSS